MREFIPQMEPVVTQAEADATHRYLQSGVWLTEFRETRRFESSLREYAGARYCVAAPSGTVALFLALKACGVGPGDEVIVPDLTMAASATAVLLAGAEVVFSDIEPRTLCLDWDAAELRLGPRTRAVVFVSLNGRSPGNLAGRIAAWQSRGIKVIEDAAQSLGSFSGGRHLGTLGDCGCLSFSSQKLVTTGQGGALFTDDEAISQRVAALRDFGRLEGGSDHYLSVGWNFKFTDLQAVIGLAQMARLPALVERKRAIYARYQSRLTGIGGLEMLHTDLLSVTPWFVDVLVDADRKSPLIEHLRDRGIGSRPFYPALHREPAFAVEGSFPVADDIARRGLWLPSALSLTDPEVDYVCETIARFLAG